MKHDTFNVWNTFHNGLKCFLPSIARELKLVAVLPLSNSDMNEEGRLCNITIQKALEDINAFPDLLEGYNLTYDYFDSQVICSEESSEHIRMFFEAKKKLKFPDVFIGGICPYFIEKLATSRSTFQIAYLATSSDLADRQRFPKVYRLTAPARVGSALVQLLATFNWNRIAIIQERNKALSMTLSDLMKELNVTKIFVITQDGITVDSTSVLQKLNILDVRIIVVSAFQDTAIEIICNAYTLDINGKHFIWIFTGHYSDELWKVGDANCTDEEMQKAVEGAFFIKIVNHNPFEESGIANITYSDLITDIRHRANVSDTEPLHYGVGKCYDHVWIAALALNCSLNSLDTLADNEDTMVHHSRISKCMDMLDYVGTSGRMRFEEGALYQNVVLKRIQDYRIPLDSGPTSYEWKFLPMSLSVAIWALAGVGIVSTLACLIFNVVWRKHSIVTMSSPNINSILLVGCLLLDVTIVIKTTATTRKVMCAVRLFCFWIGFATTFGSMLSKTWRVYRIFTNKKMKRKMSIRYKHLLVIIGILVSMETLVLIVWEISSPHRVTDQQLKTENDKVVTFYLVCVCDHSNYFNWTLHIVNGALIAIGAILAWKTRQVHIDGLNDSKTIGICLYNVVILSDVGLFLSLILKDKSIELNGVSSVCLFLGTLVSEILIFLPKVTLH